MTPETALFRASLALVAVAAVGAWGLRNGSRLSNWLDAHDPCPDLDCEEDE